ncbi:MAG: thioredoxin family protein [Bacteroidia bacterium]
MQTPLILSEITPSLLASAMSWEQYYALLTTLMEQNKTTGPDQSESMLSYARLNLQRIKRIAKTTVLLPEVKESLAAITKPVTLLIITEGWCGDAAQSLGVTELMSREMPAATVRVILRDEHTDVMDHFLTNGGRAIPIVVILDSETNEVLGKWGPRPTVLQEKINNWKQQGLEKEQLIEQVHTWYTADKSKTVQIDFLAALKQAVS